MRFRDFAFQCCIFLSIIYFLTSSSELVSGNTQDKLIQTSIVLSGKNITEATDPINAFLIDPNEGVISKIEYLVTANQSVNLRYLKTVFIIADADAISKTDIINLNMSNGDKYTFIQTWKLDNYVGNENIGLISGIYKLRYDLYYIVKGQNKVIEGSPFYIKFKASPLTSVFGVLSSVAVVATGFSFVGLANSLRTSIDTELGNSIGESRVSPTEKLKGYYRGKSYSMAQSEISKLLYGYASKLWTQEKCPQCETDWPPDLNDCPNCHLTGDEAKELYSTSLVEKSITAIKEIVDSVSGLSLKGIADKIGEGETPTASIISVVTFSGLTLVQPRVSKKWSNKQRNLIFTGLKTSLYALFWVQATGIGVISIVSLLIAILSGFLIPAIISRITGNNLKAKISEFWENGQSIFN